ncbi:TadE/TadG family type IV pilus assembly protein [Sphingomicrobium astaxanthinifaciens]|uniref:TadE/TadG family type IV pilus assembly protein n=1 Tax=Sphingomicrobium astaxanthinifaciens TaxID=1227949 RepID=UPI001FCAC16D|nr:TadE family protein [Sphingomicrobium astaxanthinifaciens]MCJ7421991.1 pilus assembly protein [Sphingomicrobium astaxanthinifaciens]
MIHKIHAMLADRRGSATIELALCAPVMALMVVGVVDLSMAYSRKLAIEQGAQRAIEKVMQTTTTETVHGTLGKEAAAAAQVPEDQVTVSYVRECDGTDSDISAAVAAVQAQLDAGKAWSEIDTSAMDCPSGTSLERRYLTVTIVDDFEPVINPSYVGIASKDGKFPITVETGIRTQ